MMKAAFLAWTLAAATQAQAQWGSLAFDENTFNFGFRVNSASEQDARDGALYWCRNAGGTNCQLKWTFNGGSCLTLSVSENRKYWYRAHDQGNHDQIAMFTIEDSLNSCRNAGGYRCAPQRILCASRSDPWQAGNQAAVSRGVAGFAQARIGQQIGDGECWTLVDQALAAAGAIRPGTSGFDTYVFGQEVYGGFQAGDILQLEDVRFQTANSYNEYPHHTAIVTAANGNVVNVLQQNVNGDRRVQAGTLDLGTRVRGRIRAYRPIPRL